MKLKPFNTKLSREMLESLHSVIDVLLTTDVKDDDDKLLFATLAQIKHRLYVKLDNAKREYQIVFTPAEAFALRILSTDYCTDIKSYWGNKLHQIANQVHKHYQ